MPDPAEAPSLPALEIGTPSNLLNLTIDPNPIALLVCDKDGQERICVKPDGRIFWHGREVETDAAYREVIVDLVRHLFPRPTP